MTMLISSPVFSENGNIPKKYTCDGADVSPPLLWEGVPADARSLVLLVEDPDAPDPAAPKMIWAHWILYNLPANSTGLAEAIASSEFPAGTLQGQNDWHQTGYRGPCPPVGRHRYFFKLYALDYVLPDLHKPSRAKVTQAIQGHIIATAQLMATYQH